ncbi:hypothetical protein COCC4DRAFT_122780 [Bipolaris maydis ATCC 48331]|uniref:Uncharacterized protein n=2 Tax=Cochliobolus heterostrophus TaxID=5016 RepID=M2UBR4_COCH5|nr:uncharacterized protein COCC4DRAFT_122780 [Bipolaris maydis ATCC 48331]EMD96009.1 hypothetical protein COCHEDRAFT_1090065 [Bipolaris maydis C5]KAJ5030712.1 hypothetical protein J3E73DRAFT_405179 [Bipolaris maydis]ENI10867.1 hypothetical protein COCC4DRAFT_122780 [Bipolaris maydis ATCC 48331]KAJ6213210.1 hypothetical protein PSV09DRAFT_1090065 [Bipolaris maydis]KAJ6274453.1 hypothetical protein PSV08DRAFT_383919 [Bipolaris maydis]
MLALTSATGKLGGAVLNAILEHKLIDPKELVVCTSTSPSSHRLSHLHAHSLTIRHADFSDPASLGTAYAGCTRLFLVSTPAIAMDYDSAPLWTGREAHHRAAIDAAVAAGVTHIYYTSLAFARPSCAAVMRAHVRTEAYLEDLQQRGVVGTTVMREGLYSESWPLYLGYYFGLGAEKRTEVVVAGDGEVSWTAIADLGFATAKVLAGEPQRWVGKTFYLCQRVRRSLGDVARVVGEVRGEEVGLKVVARREFELYYVREMGMERAAVEWWSSTYEALERGECAVEDGTLEGLLSEAGRTPVPVEVTIREMMK